MTAKISPLSLGSLLLLEWRQGFWKNRLRSEVEPCELDSDAEEPDDVRGLLEDASRSAWLSLRDREKSDSDDGLLPNDDDEPPPPPPPGLSPPPEPDPPAPPSDSRDVSTMKRGSMSHCLVDDMPRMNDVPAIPGWIPFAFRGGVSDAVWLFHDCCAAAGEDPPSEK